MEGTTRHWGQEEATDMEEKLVVNLQISGEIRKKITNSNFEVSFLGSTSYNI